MTPNFKLGFELEGCLKESCGDDYHGDGTSELWRYLEEIYGPSFHSGYDGHDCREGFSPAEIRTPALPLRQALRKLEQTLDLLALFESIGEWYTDVGCGLHINMSEATMMGGDRLQMQRFLTNVVQHYPEWAVLRAFNRENSDWNHPWFPSRLSLANRTPEWAQINDDCGNWGCGESAVLKSIYGPASERRIEFRGHGGRNYHRKTDKIAFAIDAIISAGTKAYNLTLTDTRNDSELFS